MCRRVSAWLASAPTDGRGTANIGRASDGWETANIGLGDGDHNTDGWETANTTVGWRWPTLGAQATPELLLFVCVCE